MGFHDLLKTIALFILVAGMNMIVECPLLETPPEEWTFVDFEAIGLWLFNWVMFIAVAIYCLSGLCSGIYRLLLPLIKAVGVVARTVTTLASECSKNGAKGAVFLALNMARVALLRPWASRFITNLVLGDEIAIVTTLVLPVALYVAKVKLGGPLFAYISGFIAGIVTPVDVDLEGCSYSASSTNQYKQNRNLVTYCKGSDDGFDALTWWKELQEDATSTWDFYLPIFIYSVAAMFCVFILAVLLTNRETRGQKSTQTDSTGDLKEDSTGLSEKVTQQLARIQELEGCRALSESTVEGLKGQIQLADRKVQQQMIELEGLKLAKRELQAKCQTLTERLCLGSHDSDLDQMHQQLGQEKGLRLLLTYGYVALRQLAGTFAESGLGEHLLKFIRGIEHQCESLATAGAESLEEVQKTLGSRLLALLKEAAEHASEIRLTRGNNTGRFANENAVLLKRKLRKCKRHMRSVKASLAAQMAQAGMVQGTNWLISQERMNEELDGYKRDILNMRRELNEREQKFMFYEQQLAESRALTESINQGFEKAIAEKEAVLQKLREEQANSLQRAEALQEEIAQKSKLLESQSQELTRLSESEVAAKGRSLEFDIKLGTANQQFSDEGQRRGQFQDQLDAVTRQLSAKDRELTQVRAISSLCIKCKGIEAEMRELVKKHAAERKEAGSARANAVADLHVQIIQQEDTISDLRGKLQHAEQELGSSIDIVATQRIEELELQVENFKVQEQQQSGTEMALRKEIQDLKDRLEKVGREQSSRRAVGSVFADPNKARANKLQKDVLNLRQEAKVMDIMRDRLAEEIRVLKSKYEPDNLNCEPETPLTVTELQQVLQAEKESQDQLDA
ncbi:predicted protein [Uncinocarpus reesii 1704]|uniref:Uncharacterized protein n=1 Tax=Uncinocarpus reesii (strain UAMH 1704) TaxID=336963 RepID=C4JG30_UNCRE|nr:uncharacterized protein UREG_01110 [Uncinocarpus reesii 1704]EEP76261.1 predicted protein [Uncinocarpus reesii 1704]